MRLAPLPQYRRRLSPVLFLLASLAACGGSHAQGLGRILPPLPAPGSEATLEADQQHQEGNVFYADGNVDIHYGEARLRADHVQYDTGAQTVSAHGHVQLDYLTQHLDADDARYELRTGRGNFQHVRATFAIQRRPTPTLLVTPNPLYFEAEQAERLDQDTYRIRNAWITVCNPAKPTWTFHAPSATVRMQQSVHLENGNFRLFSVPVLYLPYATLPAEERRNSGLLIPDIGNSTRKGLVLGDAFYWAPFDWADVTLGASYYSKRGWAQNGSLRMRPWQGARLDASYFGVIDRGLPQASGPPINQGGHEEHLLFTSPVPGDWRAVADLDQLSSLTFRLAFSETYTEAVNSEVPNTAFLTKSFDGYNIDLAAVSYQNYLSATAQTSVTLRSAPVARFSSLDRNLFPSIPLYFSFDAFTGAEHRADTATPFLTPGYVARSEFAPTVTMPLRWGAWLGVTSTFTFRSTYYGGQMHSGLFVDQGFLRDTEEASVDIRPPTLERTWRHNGTSWKHVIEPEIVYHYVNGVEDFSRFVRYDADETLTDTNDVELGITQRLYRRTGDAGSGQELLSWRIAQQYYFDPTFGGAFVAGQRNVFQSLDFITPFAFDDSLHHFSPVVSDLRFNTSRYDTQFRMDFDPKRGEFTAFGTLLKIKPYKESFVTLAHFSTTNVPSNPIPVPLGFTPRANQIQTLVGYGDMTRHGWNATVGFSYDVAEAEFQNQLVQVTYNTNCCGFGAEYRRFSFGTIRDENQFRVVFLIANLGSVGNLRRQEKIF
jgi:LPS-assembly protein